MIGGRLDAEEETRTAYAGRPLVEVLEDLRSEGVGIIYSSDLVKPTMRVEAEPTATALYKVLDQILGPHGLTAEVGPGGSVLIVRKPPPPIEVTITSPRVEDAVFGEVEIAALVGSPSEVERVVFFVDGRRVGRLRSPPYRIRVDVGGTNVDRRFAVVAYGRRGAMGSASVMTRGISITDELEVALKGLYVTVTRGRDRVLNLERDDFTVIDNGVREELVTFETGNVPLTAVLLLDASKSMKGRPIEAALDGARAFLARMEELDEAMVMLFSDHVVAATPFSSRQERLLEPLAEAAANGGTALNDHLFATLRILDRRQGRRVVIVLSDGRDVHSVLEMRDVLWKIRRTDALVYWIRLRNQQLDGASFASAWRGVEAHDQQQEGLEQAIEESGGRIVELERVEEMESAFEDILRELRQQYVLGYYPTDRRRDGTWRSVRVKVDAPGVRARFRAGYVDY